MSVATEYQIKDVVQLTGFTASTLRYYEEIGLLPQSARTPAGYRVYDQGAVKLLSFVARAKQLGCSLDEIRVLATAWTDGVCGPVQDRLRTLVAEKLADAKQQIAQLVTLTGELQHAAQQLERHRPDGPCDDQCGCLPATADIATATPVTLTTKPGTTASQPPIACTLNPAAMRTQQDEWRSLLAHVTSRSTVPGGVRLAFNNTMPLGELVRLTTAEHGCCPFFEFAIIVDQRGVGLEVRAPDEAKPILDSLIGASS